MSDLPDDPEDDLPEPEPVETRDLTDPKKERRYRDRLKREEQERASFWRAVLNDKVGRREIWRLIATEGRAFNTEFACGPTGVPQPEATWHNLGRQQWALRLYHDLLRMDVDGVKLLHRDNDPRFIEMKPQRRTNTGD